MIAEIGHFAILLAFAIALLQSVIPLIGAQKNWAGWMQFGSSSAVSQLGLVVIGFLSLTIQIETLTCPFSLPHPRPPS